MAVQTQKIPEHSLAEDGKRHAGTVTMRAYAGQQAPSVEKERIGQFLPMVRRIVERVITYLRPPLSFEDLVSAGTVGLIKAARDFDPSRDAEFKTYAYIRIKGAILDELRNWSFIPANLNKQIRSAFQASQEITQQTGSTPTDAELAKKLGITVDEVYETFGNARAQHFISIDGHGDDNLPLGNLLAIPDTPSPERQAERTELVDKLAEAIQQLSERKRQIILLYYHQHLTMKQIAAVFKITESRVSQLHASALFNLSVKLRQWKDGG
ncbi:MAG: FliA/WhiG family RNA polymerase sigma factor [Planctomycetota bacterium]